MRSIAITKGDGLSVRCLLDDGYNLPSVTTNEVSSISSTTATCGGNVTYDGNATVTARGVCWDTLPNPTLDGNHTTDGSGIGAFTSSITGLDRGTTYYVRAYATNSVGTAYGNEVSFTTLAVPAGDAQPCPDVPTVTDIDGNVYNTVQIGNQCWMRENLRTTHYADNTEVTERYAPNNDEDNVPTYGYMYNWAAMMHGASSSSASPSGVQGICPTGWHVPSDAEWTQLTDYVSSVPAYWCGGSSGNIAKALASTTSWSSYNVECTAGNDQSTNNATGFSALPAGYYHDGTYYNFGYYAYFWSATEGSSSGAYYRSLNCGRASVYRDRYAKDGGLSVRCLRD